MFVLLAAFLGWAEWSEWSTCNSDSEKVRTRRCLIPTPDQKMCQGSDREIRKCHVEMSNGKSQVWESLENMTWTNSVLTIFRNSSRPDGRNLSGSGHRSRSCVPDHHLLRWDRFHHHVLDEEENEGNQSDPGLAVLWVLSESVLIAADERCKYAIM